MAPSVPGNAKSGAADPIARIGWVSAAIEAAANVNRNATFKSAFIFPVSMARSIASRPNLVVNPHSPG
jgi:hypothetical protein